jgi:hypothetical protein
MFDMPHWIKENPAQFFFVKTFLTAEITPPAAPNKLPSPNDHRFTRTV